MRTIGLQGLNGSPRSAVGRWSALSVKGGFDPIMGCFQHSPDRQTSHRLPRFPGEIRLYWAPGDTCHSERFNHGGRLVADINFSRSSGKNAGWLIEGAVVLFLILIAALGFPGAGTAPVTNPQPAIETAATAPAAPTE